MHRYKNHAIRKNVAHDLAAELHRHDGDLWQQLFTLAHNRRQNGSDDLTPFWIYPEQGEPHVQIERHVPALPLSREWHRFEQLRRALAVYRMAFGQNRQEDLLAWLLDRYSAEQIAEITEQAQITLRPGL